MRLRTPGRLGQGTRHDGDWTNFELVLVPTRMGITCSCRRWGQTHCMDSWNTRSAPVGFGQAGELWGRLDLGVVDIVGGSLAGDEDGKLLAARLMDLRMRGVVF